jgi:outer membrane protein assembly factor BamB
MNPSLRASVSLLWVALLAGCGGGGGGGSGPALGLSLSPGVISGRFYQTTLFATSVTATVSGTVAEDVVVVVRDNAGVLAPVGVQITQLSATEYQAQFLANPNLAAGNYAGTLRISLCRELACATRFGGADLGYDFAVLSPATVSTVAPGSVIVGSTGVTVRISGQSFEPQSIVHVEGVPRPTTYVSGSVLDAQLPASDLASVTNLSISVRTFLPGATGLFSNAADLPIVFPAAQLQSISPASVVAGGPDFALTVLGSQFVLGSTVLVNGVPRTTNVVSPTELTTWIRAAEIDVGTVLGVAASNPVPGGGSSAATNLTVLNPAPIVASLDPGFATAGCSALTLAANGSRFVPGTKILWNGTERTTQVLSRDRLQVALSPADFASPATASVAVRIPPPGGGTSVPRSFEIRPVGPPTTVATAEHFNARHDGAATITCPTAMPLSPDWTRLFPTPIRAALIADGRAFVTRFQDGTSYIVALDLDTGSVGWGPVEVPRGAWLGYEGGRLFIGNLNDVPSPARLAVSARDAASGQLLWERDLGPRQGFPLPVPVAANGLVFVSVGNPVVPSEQGIVAFDQATGATVWTDFSVQDAGTPAAAEAQVIWPGSNKVVASDAATGVQQWLDFTAGGGLPVIFGSDVYVRDALVPGPFVWRRRDLSTGTVQETLDADPRFLLALAENRRFSVRDGELRARDLAAGTTLWAFAPEGGAESSPVVVNDTVLVSGSPAFNSALYAVDAATGVLRAAIPGAGSLGLQSNSPSPGPVIGEGWMLVLRNDEVRAYRIGADR